MTSPTLGDWNPDYIRNIFSVREGAKLDVFETTSYLPAVTFKILSRLHALTTLN